MRRRQQRGSAPLTFVLGFAAGTALMLGVQIWLDSREDPDLRHYREVRDFVAANFVREVDHDDLVKDALKGMVGQLDRYSRYYDAVESKEVERETRGRFVGIGAVFRGDLSSRQVLFPLADSPAERSGLRVGDRILRIDGEPADDFDAAEMQEALQGDLHSVVALVVVGRDGEERTVEVRRDSVVDPNVRHARMLDEEHGIGYVSVLGFSHETAEEFDRVFLHLRDRGMQALVLDLRGNPGGVLSAAVDIARRFVPEGVIVSTEGRGTPAYYEAEPDQAIYEGFSLVVLVDEGSASASEVLAGALQDHRVAVLVGAPTHGKGLVQTIRRYPDRRTIAKVTTSYYYTPSHRNLERDPDAGRDYGIAPDLEVPIGEDERQAIARHTQHYSPPLSLLPELEAWSEEVGEELVDPHPVDAQLDAAVELLLGRREPSKED